MVIRIGERGVAQEQRSLSQSRTDPNAFGQGLATAMKGLGTNIQEQAEFLAERERKRRAAEHDASWARTRGELDRAQIEAQREAERAAPGFTNNMHEALRARTTEFLSTIEDEETRRKYEEITEAYVQNSTTNAFTFEYERANTAYRDDLEQLVTDGQVRLKENPALFDEVFAELEGNIENSILTQPEREELRTAVHLALTTTEYEETLRRAGTDQLPVGEPDGNDIVAPGMPAAARGFLNTTASVESTGYDVMYGGGQFQGFDDHPRVAHEITSGPYKGQTTTAAGRYQFLARTWDFIVERMTAEGYVIEDFSPANQDRAAWWYAQHRYRQRAAQLNLPAEMRDLNAVLASGDRERIKQLRGLLAGSADGKNVVWEGLQTISDDEFANRIMGGRGMMLGPTGSSETPNLWDNPRYAELPFDVRMTMEQNAQQSLAQARQAARERDLAQQTAMFNQLSQGLNEGTQGAQDAALLALNSGTITDGEMRKKLRDQMSDFFDMQADAQEVAGMLGSGAAFTPENEEAVRNFFKATGVEAGLRERDSDALNALLMTSQRAGMVPTGITDIFRAQLSSMNIEDAAYGAQALAALYDQNPATFMQAHTREQAQEALALSLALRTSLNPQNAVERWRELNDPSTAGIRNELRETALTEAKDIKPEDMLKATTTFMQRVFTDVQLPVPTRLSQRFQAEFREMYILGFTRTGDEDKAKEFAGEMMTYSWSPDPVSGGLMEFSPASAGANVNPLHNNYEWIKDQLFTEFELEAGTTAALVPDAQTRAEIAAGVAPTYTVTAILTDPVSGIEEFSVVFGEDGLPRRFTAAPSEQTITERDNALEWRNLEERREALRGGSSFVENVGTAAQIATDVLTGTMTPLERTGDRALTENEKAIQVIERRMQAMVEEGRAPRGVIAQVGATQRSLSVLEQLQELQAIPGSQLTREQREEMERLTNQIRRNGVNE